MKKLRLFRELALAPILCAVVTLLILRVVFFVGYVPSSSMEPTIPKDSWIIGTRHVDQLNVGDVVIFTHEGKTLVKRIAAVGGDIIVHTGGVLLTVPKGCFYMLGDNSEQSLDSRYWEEPFVTKESIKSVVFWNSNHI